MGWILMWTFQFECTQLIQKVTPKNYSYTPARGEIWDVRCSTCIQKKRLSLVHGGSVQYFLSSSIPQGAPFPLGFTMTGLSLCWRDSGPQRCVHGDHGLHSPSTQFAFFIQKISFSLCILVVAGCFGVLLSPKNAKCFNSLFLSRFK